MLLVDTHTHIFEPEFDGDFGDVIASAQELGLVHLLLPNIDVESIPRLQRLLSLYPRYLSGAMGLHPTSVKDDFHVQLDIIRREFDRQPYAAVGEIGLDFYWDKTYEKEQIEAFLLQIEWSIDLNLPIIIHVRDAWSGVFACLDRFPTDKLRGVFHSFTGSADELQKVLSYPNFYVGINGVVTFKNNSLRNLLPQIPLDRLLLETDAPYLAPVPKRGKRNEPAFILHTAAHIAHCLNVDLDVIAKNTTQNASHLFDLNFDN